MQATATDTEPLELTFKLYASLAEYLPSEASRNIVTINVPASASVFDVLDRYRVPRESAHLVLINGVYVEPDDRDKPIFNNGDVLAVWPPVAGG